MSKLIKIVPYIIDLEGEDTKYKLCKTNNIVYISLNQLSHIIKTKYITDDDQCIWRLILTNNYDLLIDDKTLSEIL